MRKWDLYNGQQRQSIIINIFTLRYFLENAEGLTRKQQGLKIRLKEMLAVCLDPIEHSFEIFVSARQ